MTDQAGSAGGGKQAEQTEQTWAPVTPGEVERWMERLYVAAPGASLRREDRRKAVEVAAMLGEARQWLQRTSGREPLLVLDAAAGKGYVGLLIARLVLEPAGRRDARVITLEREPDRCARTGEVVRALDSAVAIDVRLGDVGDDAAWPADLHLVTALHACGPAADAVIDRVIARGARALLLCPCCTSRAVPAARLAQARAQTLGFPRHAAVQRRFVQAFVDAERTLRLEAAGWQTEVVELCPPTVTPHNLLWRARKVGEPARMADAARQHARLLSGDDPGGLAPRDPPAGSPAPDRR